MPNQSTGKYHKEPEKIQKKNVNSFYLKEISMQILFIVLKQSQALRYWEWWKLSLKNAFTSM